MDITNIQYYYALHNYASFQKAADSIPITVQGLRKSIRSIEEEIGVSLYLRGKDTLVFTDAGEYFYEFCRNVQEQYQGMLSSMDAVRRGSRTKISMAFSMGAFGLFSPQFVQTLLEDLSNRRLSHITRPEYEIVKGLKEGRYDFAITWGNPDPSHFTYDPIADVPFYIIVNNRHPLAAAREIGIADLKNEKLIFFDAQMRPQQILVESCRMHGFAPDTSLTTNETMVMLTYLTQNMGVGFVLPNEVGLYDRTKFTAILVRDIVFPLGITSLRQHLYTADEKKFLDDLKQIYFKNLSTYPV